MLKLRALLLLGLCFVIPARAGLLEDDDARKQIQQVEARVVKLEGALTQQTKSMMDLQSQIDALNTLIRNLRGQNEEINHGLQDAEKRQKDFYVDLDTRLRHFESAEEAAKEAAAAAATAAAKAPVSTDPSDPVPEDRAYEAAYGLYKSGNKANAAKAFQDFITKYPDSVHVPNANYWLGNAQLSMKDYKNALITYEHFLKENPESSKSSEVMYGIAGCQLALKRPIAARKTLKQLIAKYPSSEAAAKAKKQLAAK
ncbi:MAG: tol-pal system protein YbgF [Gallionella sp.]